MADHKFVYTVSGVTLSEAQQTKISQAISVAVTHALAAEMPGTVRADLLCVTKIYGGRWIPTVDAEKIGLAGVVADREGAQAAGVP